MEKRIPKKTYRNIMNSLGGGTVPKEGLGYITVGRAQEIDSLLRDTEVIQDGGATFRFVVGDYGSGKTFLLQTIKEYCVKNDYIVAEVDLSPDRSLIGNSTKKKGLATYRELMANVSNKTNQTGRALSKVVESWVNKMFERAAMDKTTTNTELKPAVPAERRREGPFMQYIPIRRTPESGQTVPSHIHFPLSRLMGKNPSARVPTSWWRRRSPPITT